MRRVRTGKIDPRKIKYFAIAIAAVFFGALAVVYPVLSRQNARKAAAEEFAMQEEARRISYVDLMEDLKKRAARFRGEAGILIKDMRTRQSIGMNQDKLYPSASLVKIPIMAAVFQAQEEGILKLDDKLKLERGQKVKSSSRLYRSRYGTAFTVRELMEHMITESDNTATNILTDALGFGYLNQKFVELGLRNTDLRRGVMDLRWRRAGIENYTTAEDMAYLLEKIYDGQLVSPRASAEMLKILKRQKVNDRLPRGLPRGVAIAHKTGLLYGTVSDVGIVFTKEGDFIICVITSDIRGYKSAKRFIGRVAACTYNKCYKPSQVSEKL